MMDSLYGDLPPPKSTEQKDNNYENENGRKTENVNPFKCTFRYVDINKSIITPATVQKKFGIKINKKINEDNVSVECDNSYEKNDPNLKDSLKKDEQLVKCINKNVNEDRKESESKEKKENLTNISEQEKNEGNEANLINGIDKKLLGISNFVQNDLKKISEQLNKIQKFAVPEWALTENAVEYVNTHHDKKNNVEQKDSDKEKVKINSGNEQEKEKGIEKKSYVIEENKQIDNDLYDKYGVGHADEEYDPLNPNDLNRIIKERKRIIFNKMSEEIKRRKFRIHIKMEQVSERETEIDIADPYEGYVDYLENSYSGKKKYDVYKNIEEQINGDELNVKKNFEINATTNKYDGENTWDITRGMETENEKDHPRKMDGHIYKEKNDEENNEAIDERTEIENEYYIPQMGNESYIQNNTADVKIPEATSKKDFATRMMEKMGWKKGEGLGKTRQGITTPLILQKVNKRGGVIVQTTKSIDEKIESLVNIAENDIEKNNINYENSNKNELLKGSYIKEESLIRENVESNNKKSRYILLKNVFTTKEMDTALKEEIEDEASHFGNLLNIHFSFDNNTSKDVTWLNILCEYESTEQASSALKGFSKKIFKGRYVNASFVNETDSLAYINNVQFNNENVEQSN